MSGFQWGVIVARFVGIFVTMRVREGGASDQWSVVKPDTSPDSSDTRARCSTTGRVKSTSALSRRSPSG